MDEKRIQLVEIESERDRMRKAIEDLAAELEIEKQTAAGSFDAAQTFAAYAARIGERQRQIEGHVLALAPSVARAAEEVAEAFRELKKYEISLDLRRERERVIEARREQAQLDEMGSAVRRRKEAI